METEKASKIVDLAASLAMKADELDQVLIIYRRKGESDSVFHGSMDNELELRDALWLVKAFELWLTLGSIGMLPRD